MVRDEWVIWDAEDNEIGLIREDSWALSLVRRVTDLLGVLLPQRYDVVVNSVPVASFGRGFSLFGLKLTVDFSPDPPRLLDKRLGLAAAVLVGAFAGRRG